MSSVPFVHRICYASHLENKTTPGLVCCKFPTRHFRSFLLFHLSLIWSSKGNLVDLLLLVDAKLSGAHVDQEEETTDNREDLEEIVLSEVLVGVVVVQLLIVLVKRTMI